VPRLYFPVDTDDFLDYDQIPTVYHVTGGQRGASRSSRLRLIVGEYSFDGRFIGYFPVQHGRIQLCRDSVSRLDAAYDVGTHYRQQVSGAIHEGRTWSHVRSVVRIRPSVPPWKLFTKHVARTNVVNLVVNLRHAYNCRTMIVNLKYDR